MAGKRKDPTIKIGTMDEYAIRLVGASLGSVGRKGLGRGLISAAKGASGLRKKLKGPK
jgi:hypothetical protein